MDLLCLSLHLWTKAMPHTQLGHKDLCGVCHRAGVLEAVDEYVGEDSNQLLKKGLHCLLAHVFKCPRNAVLL